MKPIFYIALFGLLVACSVKVSTTVSNAQPALALTDSVYVLGIKDAAPVNFITVGTVRIGDKGTSANCKWNVGIAQAKAAARKAGGNVLKINELRPSWSKSTCDRFTATIFKVTDNNEIKKISTLAQPKIDTTWNYAKLYVYRPIGIGPLVSYNLYLNKMMIGRVKNNWKQEFIVTEEGLSVLWAKTETKEELAIHFEHGKEYYVQCGVGVGMFIGRPSLRLVEQMPGEATYDSVVGN